MIFISLDALGLLASVNAKLIPLTPSFDFNKRINNITMNNPSVTLYIKKQGPFKATP